MAIVEGQIMVVGEVHKPTVCYDSETIRRRAIRESPLLSC